jgi:protein SCO1/2
LLPLLTAQTATFIMKYYRFFVCATAIAVAVASCQDETSNRPLPILGERDIAANGDTIYPVIPDFSFIDQDSQVVNNATFAGKAYIADFFFIHCPTICPKVKANGLRIYEKFKNEDRLLILSHSIDVKNDTVAALRHHAEKLGIDSRKWHLVTGDHDAIYAIADDYFSVAKEDPSSPGGFDHSGRIILVDKNRHVRSFCDGTNAESVDKFMNDIEKLLKEPL